MDVEVEVYGTLTVVEVAVAVEVGVVNYLVLTFVVGMGSVFLIIMVQTEFMSRSGNHFFHTPHYIF